MMDNFKVDCKANGDDNLYKLFDVAFNMSGAKTSASHYIETIVDGIPTLEFLWSVIPGSHKLLVRMDSAMASKTAAQWLSEVPREKWGDNADGMDGSVGAAFRVLSKDHNTFSASCYSIVAVQPIFAWYHK